MKIFLDTETTGLKPNDGDRVVEIAAIAYDGREPVKGDGGEYHQYINPGCAMPAEAFEVHGLDDAFLQDKPKFAEIADDFIAFIQGHELIMHNADFDCSFLDAELKRLNKPLLEDITANIVCSLKWSRANNAAVSSHSLDALCRHYNISLKDRAQYHSAILDTRLLGDLYFKMRRQQAEIDMPPAAISIQTSGAQIIVRRASAEEEQAHRDMLATMEKDTSVTPLYQKLNR